MKKTPKKENQKKKNPQHTPIHKFLNTLKVNSLNAYIKRWDSYEAYDRFEILISTIIMHTCMCS